MSFQEIADIQGILSAKGMELKFLEQKKLKKRKAGGGIIYRLPVL